MNDKIGPCHVFEVLARHHGQLMYFLGEIHVPRRACDLPPELIGQSTLAVGMHVLSVEFVAIT